MEIINWKIRDNKLQLLVIEETSTTYGDVDGIYTRIKNNLQYRVLRLNSDNTMTQQLFDESGEELDSE